MNRSFENEAVGSATLAVRMGLGHQRFGRRLFGIAASFIFLLVALCSLPSTARAEDAPADQPNPALSNEACLGCHGQQGLGPLGFEAAHPVEPGSPPKVLTDRFLGSVHGQRQCVECHTNITQLPHEKVTVQVSCVNCHRDLLDTAKEDNKPDAIAKLGGVVQMIDRYMKSIHAQPNNADQSHTNASCYNCHDSHYVYPKGSPNFNLWRLNLPYACGACHTQELADYKTSVHGKEALLNGNAKAAVCSDCHTGHDIQDVSLDATRLQMVKNCGSCHAEQFKSYVGTYHGQVNTLGFTFTAKCFDCHGNHKIQRVDDPASTVFPTNRLKTCQNCHTNATAGFVTFQPHANDHDFARYPYTWLASKFMLALLGGTFLFFWTHSALWYYRELRDHQQNKNRPHVRTDALNAVALSGEGVGKPVVYYQRWPAIWRVAHLGFAITVIMLVFTGMTLFYAHTAWAPVISQAFGGPRVTGIVHRVFATAFVAIFFWHLAYVVLRIGRSWKTFRWFGPDSLIPSLSDLYDLIAMLKWFFGFAPKPQLDRWTYWEKFDYWAPFWGVTIIGVSGAMLWFKEFVATYLPGWVFNVATIFHGEEAVLAAGFLFTVHFFNNHWRPDKFPLDIVMFTGKMTLEEFKREHLVEYNRLVASGELSKYLVDAPSQPLTRASKILGFTLMACGLILLAMVVDGFIGHLLTQ
jgi:cytochrome b subunit of formate dehydrogenase